MPPVTCPTDCQEELADVNFSDCAPKINLSEIRRIFIMSSAGAPLTAWSDAEEWIERLKQAGGDKDAIRTLTVIADKPAGTSVTRDISGGRQHIIGKDHTLNATIDDTSDANYEFIRKLECGGNFIIWYETSGGYMYGGNTGIKTRNVDFNDVLNRGVDEIETFEGVIGWRAKHHPERVLSPIFDLVTNDTAAA